MPRLNSKKVPQKGIPHQYTLRSWSHVDALQDVFFSAQLPRAAWLSYALVLRPFWCYFVMHRCTRDAIDIQVQVNWGHRIIFQCHPAGARSLDHE